MRVVLLSVCDAVDAWLIQRLRAVVPEVDVLRIVYRDRHPPARTSLRSKISMTKLVHRAERTFRDWHNRRNRRAVSRHLFGAPEPPKPVVLEEILASEVNDAATAERIRALAPDILLVSGAPILEPNVFSIAKVATVNVHYGVAPHYRGENTIFWPLFLGDHEHVGVTLHHINARIDAGEILAVGYPAVAEDDDEAALTAKCAKLAADLAIDLVDAADRGALRSKTQTEKGRVFLRRHRRFWHDVRYELSRRVMRRSLPVTPGHVVKHFG